MELHPAILEKGTALLLKQLEELIVQNPDLGTIHNAFEAYCTNRYSLGSSANTVESGGKDDLGIDFYSWLDRNYVVGQCKVPAQDYLEANPAVPKLFGPSVVNDPRDALQYLIGESPPRLTIGLKRCTRTSRLTETAMISCSRSICLCTED